MSGYAVYLNGERVPDDRIRWRLEWATLTPDETTPTEQPDELIPSPEERPDLGNPDRRDTPVTEPSGGSGG